MKDKKERKKEKNLSQGKIKILGGEKNGWGEGRME